MFTVPCKDGECRRPSSSTPVAHALWGALSFNRSLMKPGFARECFLVLKTRTRENKTKKTNLGIFSHYLETYCLGCGNIRLNPMKMPIFGHFWKNNFIQFNLILPIGKGIVHLLKYLKLWSWTEFHIIYFLSIFHILFYVFKNIIWRRGSESSPDWQNGLWTLKG